MLELYSLNVAVDANGDIPLNNSNFSKGCTATHSAPATIELNKKGVYRVAVNASVTPAAAGPVGIQLVKNGIVSAPAQSIATGAVGSTATLGFETLVQVPFDNTCCCASSPTNLQLINPTTVASTYSIVDVVVSKLC